MGRFDGKRVSFSRLGVVFAGVGTLVLTSMSGWRLWGGAYSTHPEWADAEVYTKGERGLHDGVASRAGVTEPGHWLQLTRAELAAVADQDSE